MLWVFLVGGGPISVAATSISEYVAIAGSINFNDESNFTETSGGFGPVQVLSVMGLSVVVAVLAVMAERDFATRLLAGVLGIIAATMSSSPSAGAA